MALPDGSVRDASSVASTGDAQTSDDTEWIRAAASGNAEAFAALYDRYAPLLFALCLRIVEDEREAQDLLHDVFMEAWEKAGEFDARRGSVRTWLLIRTRSRALDRKASARLSRRAEPKDEEASASAALEPDGVAVRAALEQLPLEVRQTLELKYFAGMTANEIAKSIGTPEGTVRSRLARGLRLLQELL